LFEPPHLTGNSSSASCFPLKNYAFETPLTLGISVNLPWDGYGYSVELHISVLEVINMINYVLWVKI